MFVKKKDVMITVDKARQLFNQYDNIDDAILYADKQYQKNTKLSYWKLVKDVILKKKNNPRYSI